MPPCDDKQLTAFIRVKLTGPFYAEVRQSNGEYVPVIIGAKQQALLALLLKSPEGQRSRGWLQDILWGNVQYNQARGSLRNALSQLRKAFGEVSEVALVGTRDAVSVNLSYFDILDDASDGDFLEGLDLRNEPAFSEWLAVQRDELREPMLAVAKNMPRQSEVARFSVQSGALALSASQTADVDENDYRRLNALLPEVRAAANDAVGCFSSGNAPFWRLAKRIERYRDLISLDVAEINYSAVYACGLGLQSVLDAARSQVDTGELPSMSAEQSMVLDELMLLHGPFILSSQDGIKLVSDAERFRRTSGAELEYVDGLKEFSSRLVAEKRLIIDQVTAEILEDVANIDFRDRDFGKEVIFADHAVKNAIIVLCAGAAVVGAAAIPTIGPILAASMGLVGVEALKKSESFLYFVKPVTKKLDQINLPELSHGVKISTSYLAEMRNFVLKNAGLISVLSGDSSEFRWIRELLERIKRG